MLADDLFSSDKVESILTDINDLIDKEILELPEDVDGVIYAIAADERVIPFKAVIDGYREIDKQTAAAGKEYRIHMEISTKEY